MRDGLFLQKKFEANFDANYYTYGQFFSLNFCKDFFLHFLFC